MKTVLSALVMIATAAALAGSGSGHTLAAPVCVSGGHGCYSTIQAAVAAAVDGDRITVAPGTYAGGVVIGKSVELRGAGADRTVIGGGGPVLTIASPSAANTPTVSIAGVTIRDGVSTASGFAPATATSAT